MCLKLTETKGLGRPVKQIAKNDIRVYKILCREVTFTFLWIFKFRRITSPYRSHRYFLGICETSILDYPVKYCEDSRIITYSVERGLHAYRSYKAAKNLLDRIWRGTTATIYEAIIPKGSEFYCNGREIASTAMIVTKRVKE